MTVGELGLAYALLDEMTYSTYFRGVYVTQFSINTNQD